MAKEADCTEKFRPSFLLNFLLTVINDTLYGNQSKVKVGGLDGLGLLNLSPSRSYNPSVGKF